MAATRPRRAAGTVSYREYEEHEVFREDAKDGKGKAESERASKRPERQRIKKSALDVLQCAAQDVPGGPSFSYAVGGAETGGARVATQR